MGYTGLPPQPADTKRTTYVFHPPDNWPTPPDGWEPSPGWQPDPSWPPAPDGWRFWVPQRQRRGVGFYIKAAGAFVTFVATVAAAWFAFRSQPAAFTTADWARQANASCDQYSGELRMSDFDALLPSSATTGGQTTSSTQRLTTMTQDWINEESLLKKEIGSLSAIRTPHDGQAAQIPAVLSAGNTLAGRMDTVADGLQSFIDQKITVTQAITDQVQNGNHVLAALRTWQMAIKSLNLTNCAFYDASPPTTPATLNPHPVVSTSPRTPPVGSATYSPAEQQLASLLDPGDLTNCVARPSAEVNGVIAALNCHTVATGPTLQPLVVQFANANAAESWFNGLTSGFVDQDNCAAGYKLGSFSHAGTVAGQLGCAYTNGHFRMVWIIDSALVGVVADGSTGLEMTQWWDNWSYVIARSG
jgi:hypothetical protein